MASFYKSYQHVKRNEGGYADDKDDAGGETYKGIARRFHPDWPGWQYIDQAKTRNGFPEILYDDEQLNERVYGFYIDKFWNPILGDRLPSQALADEMFDTAVNMNHTRAVRSLQRCLNVLNRQQNLYDDLEDDGVMGNKTLKALVKYLMKDSENLLLKMMNCLLGAHYIEYAERRPSQEKYMRGWMTRVKI